MKIIYITGNWAKVKSAKQILEPLGIEVDNVKMGTTEIQADTVEEVAIHSAKEPKVFKSITKGTIAKEKSGKYGWSWDYIFIPDGYEIPMGNYPDQERFAMWNNDGLKELAKYLKEKNEN